MRPEGFSRTRSQTQRKHSWIARGLSLVGKLLRSQSAAVLLLGHGRVYESFRAIFTGWFGHTKICSHLTAISPCERITLGAEALRVIYTNQNLFCVYVWPSAHDCIHVLICAFARACALECFHPDANACASANMQVPWWQRSRAQALHCRICIVRVVRVSWKLICCARMGWIPKSINKTSPILYICLGSMPGTHAYVFRIALFTYV